MKISSVRMNRVNFNQKNPKISNSIVSNNSINSLEKLPSLGRYNISFGNAVTPADNATMLPDGKRFVSVDNDDIYEETNVRNGKKFTFDKKAKIAVLSDLNSFSGLELKLDFNNGTLSFKDGKYINVVSIPDSLMRKYSPEGFTGSLMREMVETDIFGFGQYCLINCPYFTTMYKQAEDGKLVPAKNYEDSFSYCSSLWSNSSVYSTTKARYDENGKFSSLSYKRTESAYDDPDFMTIKANRDEDGNIIENYRKYASSVGIGHYEEFKTVITDPKTGEQKLLSSKKCAREYTSDYRSPENRQRRGLAHVYRQENYDKDSGELKSKQKILSVCFDYREGRYEVVDSEVRYDKAGKPIFVRCNPYISDCENEYLFALTELLKSNPGAVDIKKSDHGYIEYSLKTN